jgi:biopolymer transport protein ExbD
MQTAPLLTRINVTPIIDVALTLVIILLITAPMISTAKLEVALPPASTRDAEDQGFVSITVSRSGEIAVDEQLVPGTAALATALRSRLEERADADRYVVVRADAGVSHGLVREVLDAAKEGGASRLGVATRQKTGGGA